MRPTPSRPPAADPSAASPRAAILGVGACGPLGGEALVVAMCARAAKIEPRPTRFQDRRGHRISVVRSPVLPDDLQGSARLSALGAPALREAAAPLGGEPAPLLVAASAESAAGDGASDDGPRSDGGARVHKDGAALVAALAADAGVPVDVARSEVFRAGAAGFALAVARALELLDDPATPAVLVGGVDTYYDEPLLAALDRDGRLNALDQQGGMTPSEGAAFLLLGREGGAPLLGRVRFVASAPAAGAPVEAMVGLLAAAARAAGPVPWVLSDVNGEPCRLAEWAAVEARVRAEIAQPAHPAEPPRHERWVEELGDLGAATGATLAALACVLWDARCAPAPAALIALSSDDGQRAALVLEAASTIVPTAPPPSGIAAEPAVAVPAPAPPPRFRASVGTPAVHRIVDGGDPPPLTEEARAQMRRMCRDCLEDIAIYGDLWRQREEEPASVAAGLEQRVLDNLDALLAALRRRSPAEAVKEVLRAASEITFPDRGRGFAVALALGCIEGEEAAQAAVSAMRRAHPGTLPAWELALRLASSPSIPAAMARLLRSERTPLVRVALEVLRARRAVDAETLAPLLAHAEPRVRAAAARCAAGALSPAAARAALEPRLADPDDAVALAAAEGLLLAGEGCGPALAWMRRRLAEDPAAPSALPRELRAQVARLLAFAGGAADLPLLLAAVGDDPRAAEVLGWYGHPGAIPALITLLDEVDRALASHEPVHGADLAVARALHRITGAPPSVEAAAWRAFVDASPASPAARLRFGEPYTPAASLRELDRDDTPLRVRRECALEATLHLGPRRRLDADTWTALQRSALAALHADLQTGAIPPHPPGAWLADL